MTEDQSSTPLPFAEARNVLLVSPHPDDEMIGAGATALALQSAGYHIVNFALSLGNPDQRKRRRSELTEACTRAGFELIVPEKPASISRRDDLVKAETYVSELLKNVYTSYNPAVVIMPSVHDGHPAHELVARATRDTLSNMPDARIWMYNIWGNLPYPTIFSPFGQETLDKAIHALDAHAGENARNDYHKMVRGRALLGSVLGSEQIFGFGSPAASDLPYAELLTEVVRVDNQWIEGTKRVLDTANPFPQPDSHKSLDFWMNSQSPYQQYTLT